MEIKSTKIKLFRRSGGTGSGSGSISIQDEGVSLGNFDIINFIGSDVEARDDGSTVDVYIPPPPPITYSSHFNTNDGADTNATVSNISTTTRYIASPTSEGNPFKLGDWSGGTQHPAINVNSITYETLEAFSILNNTSTVFTATLYDADGSSPLAIHTLTLTGNYDSTVNNIRIQISNFQADDDKYQAEISITYNVSTILPNGGRFSVKMEHSNGGDGVFIKTQNDIFYDSNNNTATIAGLSINETSGQVNTQFLSGVEYYDLGSQFTVNISDIDYINDRTYPSTVLQLFGSEYGLSSINESVGALSGWSNIWSNVNSSYSKSNWEITSTSFYSLTSTGNVSARAIDWVNGSLINSSNTSIAVNTYSTLSTRLIERFWEESWRCDSTSNFDQPNQRGWDSTQNLGASDACFWDSGVGRCTIDFSIYDPNKLFQPDYSSSQNTTVFLYREFQHNGGASSGFTLNVTGTYESIEYKLAKAYDGTASGGTVWVDALKDFNSGDWNYGDPQNNSGGRTGSGAGYISLTFGTNNIVNCDDTLYLKIGFTGSQKITGLNIVFD